MPKFRIVDGNNRPKPYRGRAKGDLELIVCPKCGCGTFIEVHTGVYRKEGKRLKDSYKSLACVECMAKGRVVLVD